VDKIEIDYNYGFSGIPNEIRRLCRALTIKFLFQDNVIEEGIKGRDDFNPTTEGDFLNDLEDIFSRYSIEDYSMP
ncbi:MAG: hypothetical protein ABEJ66_01875, partial [Candidatus Nanohaloarchaea archaeon]